MNPIPLLGRLWRRHRHTTQAAPTLRLQTRGLDAGQLQHLRQLLQPLQDSLAIDWSLVGDDGDVVLVGPQQGHAWAALGLSTGTIVCDLPQPGEPPEAVLARFERRQRALLAQLRALPQVRRRSPHFGASGWDPEVVDTVPGALDTEGQAAADDDEPHWDAPSLPLELERALRRARSAHIDGLATSLHLGYGPQAVIELDFALGQAWLDPAAQRSLRVLRRLPTVVEPCRASADALPREPAAVLWDLGLAAGGHRLLGQPPDWWAARLHGTDSAALMARATLPSHRRLAAVLAAGPTTPEDLVQLSGVPLSQLRRFVQAALMLDLLRWGR